MPDAGTILAEARKAAGEADAGHCGCCDNPEAERIYRKAMLDLLNVAVHALQCVRDLDDDTLVLWSWGGDECPLEQATAMRDDILRTVEGGA